MGRQWQVLSVLCFLILLNRVNTEGGSAWKWACNQGKCEKLLIDALKSNEKEYDRATIGKQEPMLSLEACKMFCDDYGLLWPRPTIETELGSFLSKINIDNINFQIPTKGNNKFDSILDLAGQRFKQVVSSSVPNGFKAKSSGKALTIFLVNENPDIQEFSLDMDESYTLRVSSRNDRLNATITGNTYFGVRHGLETLSQLIFYDDIRDHLLFGRAAKSLYSPSLP